MNSNFKPYRTGKNTSGAVGVYFGGRRKRWRAEIIQKGKKAFLGYFNTFADAAEARKEAVFEYDGNKNKEEQAK